MDLQRSHSKRLENIVEQSSSEVIIVVIRPKTFSWISRLQKTATPWCFHKLNIVLQTTAELNSTWVEEGNYPRTSLQ